MVYASVVRSAIPKRIPTIRFRKGGDSGMSSASDGFLAAAVATGRGPSGGSNTPSRPTIEDWQLPRRYWRKELDDKEIDYINRGGPE
ncbi:uncharacterized protein LOC132266028 [Phlebotomus argentipes]|uniref:uncharacterized protein LOC132266028 n=1 Tax=Phlebotomus argentipes TaxID=94469 RepID=UPI0028930D7A|nr:uncharacterized protein LOC132266028 [Phlebotomus argentipes]